MRRARRRAAQLLGVLCGLAVAAVLIGDGVDTWATRTERVLVPLPRLTPDLEGLRIAVLSDLHVDPGQPRWFVPDALARVRESKPDLIVLPGDFVSGDWRHLEGVRKQLAGLSAPLGVYACLGNHDWFMERGPHVRGILEQAGIRVLTDEAVPLPGHSGSWLIGLDVYGPGHGDLDDATAQRAEDDFAIVLSHTPDAVLAASRLGIDLVVSGHNHGGQVCLPFLGAPIVPSDLGPRFASGLFDVNGTRLFVTRGLGSHPDTMRFRCPPQVALLTLTGSNRSLPRGRWGVGMYGAAREFWLLCHDVRRLLRRL